MFTSQNQWRDKNSYSVSLEIIPILTAYCAISARFLRLSFSFTATRCLATVFGVIWRNSLTSGVDYPLANSLKTSRSRLLRDLKSVSGSGSSDPLCRWEIANSVNSGLTR